MIIEFFGISGVGKSTIAKMYYENNENMEWPRYNLYEKNNWLIRNVKKSISIFYYGLINFKWLADFYKILSKTGIQSLKEKNKILFNGIHLKYMLSKCNNGKKYIFDEGVFQMIWAIYLRSNELPKKEIIEKILTLFVIPDKLIIVDAKNETIKNRLINRGRKTKILETSNLTKKISEMKEILNAIIEFSKETNQIRSCEIKYINNDEDKNSIYKSYT